MSKVPTGKAYEPISERQPFQTYGALSGGRYTGDGILPAAYRAALERDRERTRANGRLYVVYSYATPIAWTDGETWTIPDVRYSVTTSRHQNKARLGARYSGLPIAGDDNES